MRGRIKETPEMRCGFVEFSDASAASSALLFDRSSFVGKPMGCSRAMERYELRNPYHNPRTPPSPGQQITVELCDEPMTDEVRASERFAS